MSRLGSGFLFPIQFTVDSGCAASMGHMPTITNQWWGSYKDMANPSSCHMDSGVGGGPGKSGKEHQAVITEGGYTKET